MAGSRHGSDARIGELLKTGFEHRNRGRHAAAQECFEEILALDLENADALHLLGHLLSLQGGHGEAIPLLERAAELQPSSAKIHFNLGNAYDARGLLNEALARFENALRLRPGSGAALNNLANIARKLGMTDRLETCYRELTRLKSTTARHFSDLGNSLLEQGRLDEAIACYWAALDIDSDFVAAHSNLLFAMNCHPGGTLRNRQQTSIGAGVNVMAGGSRTALRPSRIRSHAVLRHRDPAQVSVYCYCRAAGRIHPAPPKTLRQLARCRRLAGRRAGACDMSRSD